MYRILKRPDLVTYWAEDNLKLLEPWVEIHPDDTRALYFLAGTYEILGRREEAMKCADQAVALDPEDGATYYNVACMYANMGEVEKAIDLLERAVSKGFTSREWIENDGDLLTLHGHPRFQALLGKL